MDKTEASSAIGTTPTMPLKSDKNILKRRISKKRRRTIKNGGVHSKIRYGIVARLVPQPIPLKREEKKNSLGTVVSRNK